MPIKFTKNGVESSLSGSEKFFKTGWKKIKHSTKEPLFSLFLQKKKFKQNNFNKSNLFKKKIYQKPTTSGIVLISVNA